MKNSVRNLINNNSTLLNFTYLKNVKWRGVVYLTIPYTVTNIKEVNI